MLRRERTRDAPPTPTFSSSAPQRNQHHAKQASFPHHQGPLSSIVNLHIPRGQEHKPLTRADYYVLAAIPGYGYGEEVEAPSGD